MPIFHTLRRWLRLVAPSFAPTTAKPLAFPVEISLAQGHSTRLGRIEGRTLSCLAGCLWITHDGDPKDIVVEEGESYRVAREERTIVHALCDGKLMVV
jgi:hypothetical protein